MYSIYFEIMDLKYFTARWTLGQLDVHILMSN